MSINPTTRSGFVEFVALSALTMSMVALAIDAILPALQAIDDELGFVADNHRQFVVAGLFLGLGLGQLLFGPASDSIGRRRPVMIGTCLFIGGGVLAAFANSVEALLLGRFLQGIGLAGPRTIITAIIRDQFNGRLMARVMSFVMTIFILVPMIAPLLGQAILVLSHWRGVFWFMIAYALVQLLWFYWRQNETLAVEDRVPFRLASIGKSAVAVLSDGITMIYTMAVVALFGAFSGYLLLSQQIFQVSYQVGDAFPWYFALLALALGIASLVNTRLVMTFGMRRLVLSGLWVLSGLSLLGVLLAWLFDGLPPLWALMCLLLSSFFVLGLLFGNLNALSMSRMGAVAGMAAAIIGTLSTVFSTLIGSFIGSFYSGNIYPLMIGFALCSAAALFIVKRDHSPIGEDQ